LTSSTNASNKPELEGATIFVSLFPCNECAKLIVQVGIREVVYLSDKYADQDLFKASRRILQMASVDCRELEPSQTLIQLRLQAE